MFTYEMSFETTELPTESIECNGSHTVLVGVLANSLAEAQVKDVEIKRGLLSTDLGGEPVPCVFTQLPCVGGFNCKVALTEGEVIEIGRKPNRFLLHQFVLSMQTGAEGFSFIAHNGGRDIVINRKSRFSLQLGQRGVVLALSNLAKFFVVDPNTHEEALKLYRSWKDPVLNCPNGQSVS